jgi:hypothetical protein
MAFDHCFGTMPVSFQPVLLTVARGAVASGEPPALLPKKFLSGRFGDLAVEELFVFG